MPFHFKSLFDKKATPVIGHRLVAAFHEEKADEIQRNGQAHPGKITNDKDRDFVLAWLTDQMQDAIGYTEVKLAIGSEMMEMVCEMRIKELYSAMRAAA
ncbi:BcepGomrgp57 [Burkholderia phage BcepGomr]|uniref:BcepGomrgp57 n=1 Tax=Burkholderia phage BcepGomr TaxID=437329 RepID=UPI000150350A|nr:BcepGomrgp57 [Burkholderia phage BcepGomr]ABP63628.1 BcepGomrgp57 [Burkholderia phage BcepGomr]